MAYEAAKEEAEDRAEKAEQKVSVTLEEEKNSWTKEIKQRNRSILWDLLFHCHLGDQADAKEANSAG